MQARDQQDGAENRGNDDRDMTRMFRHPRMGPIQQGITDFPLIASNSTGTSTVDDASRNSTTKQTTRQASHADELVIRCIAGTYSA